MSAITQYLPVETEVVIARNGSHQWYTTKKEINLTTYATAICPMRPELSVLSAEVNGFRIWFLENQMRVQVPEETVKTIQSMKLVSLEYDVPAVVSTHPSRYRDENGRSFQHPSQWMWGLGVRTTLSCWILPADKIPYKRLRSLTRAGCQWRVTKIDVEDAANHLQRAIVALRRELQLADERYESSMTAAYNRQQERGESEESLKTYENDQKRVEKARTTAIDNVEQGSRALGIPLNWIQDEQNVPNVVTVGTLTNRVAQRSLMHSRVEAHCNAVEALTVAGHTAVADAVETGSMPHDIAADFAEENEVDVNGDGTYSLRDLFKGE